MRDEGKQLRFVSVELVPSRVLAAALRELVLAVPQGIPASATPGSKAYPFHLTLLFTVISVDLSAEIATRVAALALTHAPFSILFGGYRLFSDGSLVLLADKNRQLLALHRSIVNSTKTLPRLPRKDTAKYFTRTELEHFMRVGDPYALERFVPHITLARFAERTNLKDITSALPEFSQQFRFSELRVRAWSDETTAARTIIRRRLGKPARGK